jgi:hypothetical protein
MRRVNIVCVGCGQAHVDSAFAFCSDPRAGEVAWWPGECGTAPVRSRPWCSFPVRHSGPHSWEAVGTPVAQPNREAAEWASHGDELGGAVVARPPGRRLRVSGAPDVRRPREMSRLERRLIGDRVPVRLRRGLGRRSDCPAQARPELVHDDLELASLLAVHGLGPGHPAPPATTRSPWRSESATCGSSEEAAGTTASSRRRMPHPRLAKSLT